MTVDRNRQTYQATPQAAGSERIYSLEGQEGTRHTLAAAVPQVWRNLRELAPGLWVVRVISGCQSSCQIQVSPRGEVINPTTGAVPAGVTALDYPRSTLFDPIYSAVAEAAGRASVLEIDVDNRGAQLWGQCLNERDCRVLVSLVAPRAAGWGGGDEES